jgi:hypothetical protein
MVKRCLAVLGMLLMAAACGGGSGSGGTAPTASSVSVQSGDLPSGMVKCDLSGSIDSFLAKEKTQDPTSYSSLQTEWADAKSKGATSAYTAFYADTTSYCTAIKSNATDIGSASYKLVVNFVVQFKDEASAVNGYNSDSIFGFSASQLKTAGNPVQEGTSTGLGANSIQLSASAGTQTYFIAVWQKKAFMVILAVLNVDSAASKKVATSENGRIA